MAKRRSEGEFGPEWVYTEPRDKVLTVMMTASQQEAFKKVAREAKMSASSWLLEAALKALPKSEVKKW